MSILLSTYVDLTHISKVSGNIISCCLYTTNKAYNKLDLYTEGIKNYFSLNFNYKIVLFYDDSVPEEFINSLDVIPFKVNVPEYKQDIGHVGMFMMLMRYLPMLCDEFKYNNMIISDVDKTKQQWIRTIKSINKSKYNTFWIPLAGNLLVRNLATKNLVIGLDWKRISGYGMVIKGNQKYPPELLDDFIFNVVKTPEYKEAVDYILKHEYMKANESQGLFIYGCDEIFLLYVYKYILDNQLPYEYNITQFTHRTPFYYWLENFDPSLETQEQFLKEAGLDYGNINDFLTDYKYTDSQKICTQILKNVKNLDIYFDNDIIESIIRFSSPK